MFASFIWNFGNGKYGNKTNSLGTYKYKLYGQILRTAMLKPAKIGLCKQEFQKIIEICFFKVTIKQLSTFIKKQIYCKIYLL